MTVIWHASRHTWLYYGTCFLSIFPCLTCYAVHTSTYARYLCRHSTYNPSPSFCILYAVFCILYSEFCILYSAYCILYSGFFILYSVSRTLHSACCVLYAVCCMLGSYLSWCCHIVSISYISTILDFQYMLHDLRVSRLLVCCMSSIVFALSCAGLFLVLLWI